MWIVFNALLLYNVAVQSGRFDQFRDWVLNHLPNDRRVVLVVIGFCFGALLEGIAGFGTPVAITSPKLLEKTASTDQIIGSIPSFSTEFTREISCHVNGTKNLNKITLLYKNESWQN
jgi:hypothetical protein